MRFVRLFIPILSLCLSLAVSLSGIAFPQFSLPIRPAHTGVVERDNGCGNLNVANGVLQHNRAIAFLTKFDALRPTFAIIMVPQASDVLPTPHLSQENNSFHKDYIHSLLPQKMPEER